MWVRSLDWRDPLKEGPALTPVFFPGESHGQRSLGRYSSWDRKESDTTEAARINHPLVQLPHQRWAASTSQLPKGPASSDKTIRTRDFPGGPVVKTLSSNAGGAGSIPSRGGNIPYAS